MTITETAIPQPLVKQRLRELREGQVLRLADDSFAVVATHRQRRLVHVYLESEDGASATLIGVPGARVRLCDMSAPWPLQRPDDDTPVTDADADPDNLNFPVVQRPHS